MLEARPITDIFHLKEQPPDHTCFVCQNYRQSKGIVWFVFFLNRNIELIWMTLNFNSAASRWVRMVTGYAVVSRSEWTELARDKPNAASYFCNLIHRAKRRLFWSLHCLFLWHNLNFNQRKIGATSKMYDISPNAIFSTPFFRCQSILCKMMLPSPPGALKTADWNLMCLDPLSYDSQTE